MRPLPLLLLLLGLGVALTGCGDDSDDGGSSTSNGTSSTSNGTTDDLVATSNSTGPVTNCSQGCVGEGSLRVAPAELKMIVLGGKAENTLTFINNGMDTMRINVEVKGSKKQEFSVTCDGTATAAGEIARFEVTAGTNVQCDFLWKPEVFEAFQGVMQVTYSDEDGLMAPGSFEVDIVGELY